jgi:hypothetical protein
MDGLSWNILWKKWMICGFPWVGNLQMVGDLGPISPRYLEMLLLFHMDTWCIFPGSGGGHSPDAPRGDERVEI